MLPEICFKCRKLKDASLGQKVKVRGRCHDRRFICIACLGKTEHDFERGRQRAESPLEKRARLVLQTSGQRFIQEKALGPFWFDFVVEALRLLIEVDGWTYHRRPWQRRRDQAKDALGEQEGYQVVRLRNTPTMEVELEAALARRVAELSGNESHDGFA